MNDKTIVEMFFDRDQAAIAETERKYKGYCLSIAGGILSDTHDSEECVNDALLAAWNSIPPKKPENLRTFLAKLVRNIAINRYRAQKAIKRGGTAVDIALGELEAVLPSRDDTESVVDSVVLGRLLDSFLATLGRDARLMFIQRYWFFRSVNEIARDLSVSESKVKVTLLRVRARLANRLEKEGYSI